jgi:hypothetical protein
MEEKATIAESALDHAKEYAQASFDLIKLKAVNKGSEVASVAVSYFLVTAALILFITIVSIGAALWVGELIGKVYYGFFIVAGFYALVALIIYLGRQALVKKPIANMVIKKYLNEIKAQK